MGQGNFNRIRINLGARLLGRVNRPWVAPVDSCWIEKDLCLPKTQKSITPVKRKGTLLKIKLLRLQMVKK